MFAWSFPVASQEQIARVLRALGRHRYIQGIDHRLHWSVDAALTLALSELEDPAATAFHVQVQRLKAVHNEDPSLELTSRDGRLWRSSTADELNDVLAHFWTMPARASVMAQALSTVLRGASLPETGHAAFAADPDEPPHPELVMFDWVLLPVDALDASRHAGVLRAMEESGDEVNASEPIYIEGPTLAEAELSVCAGDEGLPSELFIWADGPYSYCDYIFRGVARAAKLSGPPLGYRDIDRL